MVRGEDPPAEVHHFVLGKTSAEIPPVLIGLPWVKAVVSHDGGYGTGKWKAHFHYHVYAQFDRKYTKVNIKNLLKKHEAFATHSGNPDWSFRPHDNYENWCQYVVKNHTAKLVKFDEMLQKAYDERKVEDQLLVLKPESIQHVVDGQAVKVVPRKSKAMRVLFVEWLEEHRDFRRCETITLDNQDEMRSIINDELCDYWEMAFAFNQAIQMVNHAYWVFATPPVRARIRSKFQSAILKSNYLV